VIRAVPPLNPDTTPVEGFTVATVVLLLLQVPANGVLANVAVVPSHIVVVPVIAVGLLNTVTVTVDRHPVASIT
jgi:hypothetical protein